MLRQLGAILAVTLACGGSGKGESTGPTAGESSGGDVETPENGGGGEQGGEAGGEEGGGEEGGATQPEGTPAAVTFVLKNSHTTELAFNLDQGWGTNIFAYSGKPPKAKPILMFPKFCTAMCDAADEERCPVCPQPEKLKDIKAAQKLEKVAAGATLEVPWDGKALVYGKGKGTRNGKNVKCECSKAEEAPAETYTVKACGLRLTTQVGTNSQLQCVEGSMTLPATEPIKVELDFGAPPAAPGKKTGKKKKGH
jgi:hypothetical protein